MKLRLTGPLAGLLIILAGAPAALAGPAKVSVRVEGQRRTLLSRTVATPAGSFTKDGDAAHTCEGGSGGAALQAATHGRWGGSYSDGLGYFVKTILGERHSGTPDFWTFWVNHKEASAGACSTELRPGDDVLFFVDRCVYDTKKMACAGPPVLPLGLRAPARAKQGARVRVQVVVYAKSGKASPERGATVFAGGRALGRTDAHGHLTFRPRRARTFGLSAHKRGLVRSERETLRVTRAR